MSTKPGWIELTRTPSVAQPSATAFVSVRTAPFAAALRPKETLCCVTETTLRYSSVALCSSGTVSPMPALLTRMPATRAGHSRGVSDT